MLLYVEQSTSVVQSRCVLMQGYDKNSKLTKMTAASTNLWYTTGPKLLECFIVIWVTNNLTRTFQNFHQILMQDPQWEVFWNCWPNAPRLEFWWRFSFKLQNFLQVDYRYWRTFYKFLENRTKLVKTYYLVQFKLTLYQGRY